MNLSTHIMFGLLVGALFFGRPEIALMVGVGSAIPDIDREYGFFSKESFRLRQIHRALFHNFLFIGIVYLVNPFFGIGAFLHSFLDSFTTTRDRGVEWLYPFSRMVSEAVYDSDGKKLPLDPKHKIYFLSNDLPGLTQRTTKDIKPGETPKEIVELENEICALVDVLQIIKKDNRDHMYDLSVEENGLLF